MADDDGRWITAAQALELVAHRFAAAMKSDVASAREEAKAALLGALACDRLRACPSGCLTSAFIVGSGRPGDFSHVEYDEDGNGQPLPMEVHQEGEYVFVPSEFWQQFRNPAAGVSANWQDGHFSFRLAASLPSCFVGEVRHLCFDRASVEQIGIFAPNVSAATRTGDPGRPELGATLYMLEFERRNRDGELERSLADQARALLAWFRSSHPEQQAPSFRTIENRIRADYRKARNPTK